MWKPLVFVIAIVSLLCAISAPVSTPVAQAQVAGPIGTIVAFAGPLNKIPAGWLFCDGHTYNRKLAQYRALFDAIGSSWGGDGADGFRVPDLRGEFIRGMDNGAHVDPDTAAVPNGQTNGRYAKYPNGNAGDNVGTYQSDTFRSHSHAITDPGHVHSMPQRVLIDQNGGFGHGGNPGAGSTQDSGDTKNTGSNTTGVTVQPTGDRETRPANASVIFIIRYQ